MDYPAELRTRRARVGLSQRQLAAHVGLTQSGISHLECGIRRPHNVTRLALDRALKDLERETTAS